jgi:Flp pilus assembly pilin Flp
MSLSRLRIVVRKLPSREEGQTMAEYGVVLAVISVATVGVFAALSAGVVGVIERVIDVIPG